MNINGILFLFVVDTSMQQAMSKCIVSVGLTNLIVHVIGKTPASTQSTALCHAQKVYFCKYGVPKLYGLIVMLLHQPSVPANVRTTVHFI